ncbi:hypothetical protein PI124_g21104 [Phytophthora idaei]|nr:hypothetical protein PI125_g22688 [Phytophthora idaei]KAG3130719.1 hypothetical protein PI126_g20374 [Phytophthora idaei]KAG3233828.1 hypothetical protein PI124_g21104 [Phytophthora idaei]
MLDLLLHTVLSKRYEITSKLDANTISDVRCKCDLGEDVAYASSYIKSNAIFSEWPNSGEYQSNA